MDITLSDRLEWHLWERGGGAGQGYSGWKRIKLSYRACRRLSISSTICWSQREESFAEMQSCSQVRKGKQTLRGKVKDSSTLLSFILLSSDFGGVSLFQGLCKFRTHSWEAPLTGRAMLLNRCTRIFSTDSTFVCSVACLAHPMDTRHCELTYWSLCDFQMLSTFSYFFSLFDVLVDSELLFEVPIHWRPVRHTTPTCVHRCYHFAFSR